MTLDIKVLVNSKEGDMEKNSHVEYLPHADET